ncbi:MAG: hypothetical protein RBU37_21155 [Myxococcota bacterium]|jgi:hypothetical protein|nr:hypothetical protein [Myxococcota bacterium]
MRVLGFCSVLFVLLGVSGCKSSVDPAYLEARTKWADAICACTELPRDQSLECMRAVKSPEDKSPTGEPTGIYENGLKEEDQAKLEAALNKATKCTEIISSTAMPE